MTEWVVARFAAFSFSFFARVHWEWEWHDRTWHNVPSSQRRGPSVEIFLSIYFSKRVIWRLLWKWLDYHLLLLKKYRTKSTCSLTCLLGRGFFPLKGWSKSAAICDSAFATFHPKNSARRTAQGDATQFSMVLKRTWRIGVTLYLMK